MSTETLIGTLLVLSILILATLVPIAGRALGFARAESRAPSPGFPALEPTVEPVVEAPSKDPERLGFEEAVERMLARYPVSMLDRSRLAGEIEHHWQQHLSGVATWATAFAAVEAWVRRQTQIERPLTQRQIQTLRDPRVAGSARRTVVLDETAFADQGETNPEAESDRVALAGVRDLIEGRITQPLPGTLAARVHEWAESRALQLVDDINDLIATDKAA